MDYLSFKIKIIKKIIIIKRNIIIIIVSLHHNLKQSKNFKMKSKVNNTNRKNIEAAFQNPLGMEIRNNQEIREAIANHAKSIIEKLHEERKKMIFVKKYLIIDAEREAAVIRSNNGISSTKFNFVRCHPVSSSYTLTGSFLLFFAAERVSKLIELLGEVEQLWSYYFMPEDLIVNFNDTIQVCELQEVLERELRDFYKRELAAYNKNLKVKEHTIKPSKIGLKEFQVAADNY